MATVRQANPTASRIRAFVAASRDQSPVSGLTHNFYRYPARFSAEFVRAAIRCFSRPDDLVLDPYMGGGTTIIEAMVSGRRAVGSDVNSLGVFVARVKTSVLDRREREALEHWAATVIPMLSYRNRSRRIDDLLGDPRAAGLELPRGRFLKKLIADALTTLTALPTKKASDFVRCAILKAGMIALDGRARHTPASEFRALLMSTLAEMIQGADEFARSTKTRRRTVMKRCAKTIHQAPIFAQRAELADLVVTSPPYPGVHVLYHRWQLDGRREVATPYWIAACNDGEFGSYYTFGDRKSLRTYFENSLRSLEGVRSVMRSGARIVQMIAFTDPRLQLPRYLRNMEAAGFTEEPILGYSASGAIKRIWRNIPGRRWHAQLQGATASSREVVLIHRASQD